MKDSDDPIHPADATGLVKAVHRLRQHPIGNLTANELRRLIGQEAGLQWLLPLTFEALLETGRMEAAGGFCDDDLLQAVLTRSPEIWAAASEMAREVKEILATLQDLCPYIQSEAEEFVRSLPDEL